MNPSILVVDDEQQIRDLLKEIFTHEGYVCDAVPSGEQAVDRMGEKEYDLVVTDLKLPGIDGMEVLKQAVKLHPETKVVFITGFGTVDNALEAMKSGAFDYILKPFKINAILPIIQKALKMKALEEENILLHRTVKEEFSQHNIIGKSKVMQTVFHLIDQ